MRLAALIGDRDGGAALEFALVAPLLLLLLGGLTDGARLIAQSMQLQGAADAGAAYAERYGWDDTAVSAAVRAATPLAATATISSSNALGCTQALDAKGNCPGGAPAVGKNTGEFVTVQVQAPFVPLLPWKSAQLSFPSTVTAQSKVRVQ